MCTLPKVSVNVTSHQRMMDSNFDLSFLITTYTNENDISLRANGMLSHRKHRLLFESEQYLERLLISPCSKRLYLHITIFTQWPRPGHHGYETSCHELKAVTPNRQILSHARLHQKKDRSNHHWLGMFVLNQKEAFKNEIHFMAFAVNHYKWIVVFQMTHLRGLLFRPLHPWEIKARHKDWLLQQIELFRSKIRIGANMSRS